jgi:hypothetical protein
LGSTTSNHQSLSEEGCSSQVMLSKDEGMMQYPHMAEKMDKQKLDVSFMGSLNLII